MFRSPAKSEAAMASPAATAPTPLQTYGKMVATLQRRFKNVFKSFLYNSWLLVNGALSVSCALLILQGGASA